MFNLRNSIVVPIFFIVFSLIPFSLYAADNQQEQLSQYISDLQKNPNDTALREKIIKHVQTMKPAPAVPTEIMKHEGAAEYAFKNAKNESDYLDSAKEYEKALLIAPWIATDYFNCGVAYEKAGQFKNAIIQFNFYLLAAPEAQDANAVRKRIGGLEYAAGKAAKEPSIQAIAVPKRNTFEDLLRKIDGRRYTCTDIDADGVSFLLTIDIMGKVFKVGTIFPQNYKYQDMRGYIEGFRDEIRGRETTVFLSAKKSWEAVSRTYVISEDGDRIVYRVLYNDGDTRQFVFVWQR